MTMLNEDILNGKVYSRKEVAEMLHVTTITIDNYIKGNKLKALKLANRKVLITETDLKEFLDNQVKNK